MERHVTKPPHIQPRPLLGVLRDTGIQNAVMPFKVIDTSSLDRSLSTEIYWAMVLGCKVLISVPTKLGSARTLTAVPAMAMPLSARVSKSVGNVGRVGGGGGMIT